MGWSFLDAAIPVFAAPVPSAITNTMVLTVEGSNVWIFPIRDPVRHPAYPEEILYPKDRGQTGPRSRATLQMFDRSVTRIDELSDFEIPPPPDTSGPSIFKLLKGAIYLFHRGRPTDLEIQSTLATAATRGTEFHVRVDEQTGRMTLTLLEGEAELRNANGSLQLSSGEQGVADPGLAPYKTAVIDTVNVIQWCLYYPATLDSDALAIPAADAPILAEALAAYREGDLLRALAAYPAGRVPGSPEESLFLAALLLSVGQVEQAGQFLGPVLLDNSGEHALLADALNRVIAAVQYQPDQSGDMNRMEAYASLAGDAPGSLWLAQSYLEQSRGRLAEARKAARMAVERSPRFGFAWARLAEMEFSHGRTTSALQALDEALVLTPRNAQALALKGFLLSAQNKTTQALEYFERAIEVDGALGNAWLGRGLCRIRRGHAHAGRQDLQIAAALEPRRALLRSYLGKAYQNEGDVDRALRELHIAESLDPQDPTAWLYLALVHQQDNAINTAVRDLEASQALNDNRALYRSRLLLDQDRAVRGANLASVYSDAGMTDVSTREAGRAVAADYANYSSHLFLANSYNEMRDLRQVNLRFETPWLSEYLVANLLSPVGAGTLAQSISQQEYSKLFERDRLGLISETDYGSDGEWFQNAVQHGTFGNSAYAAGVIYHSANGFYKNNDIEQHVYTLRWKQQLTPNDTLFFQGQTYDAEAGDVRPRYDPYNVIEGLRTEEKHNPVLLAGLHHTWSPEHHTLFLAGYLQNTFTVTNPVNETPLFVRIGGGPILGALPVQLRQHYKSELDIFTSEAQHIWQTDRHTLIGGTRYQSGDIHAKNTQSMPPFPLGSVPSQDISTDMERISIYAYEHWALLPSLTLVGGVTYDHLTYPVNFRFAPLSTGDDTEDQVSPKAGFIWTPLEQTTLRGAYTRSLGGVSIDQSYQLEPSQVAGFNQLYRSLIPEAVAGANSAAEFDTWNLSLEQRFGTGTYLGVRGELLESSVDRTVGVMEFDLPFSPGSATFQRDTTQKLRYREQSLTFTANQLVGDRVALGGGYRLSHSKLHTEFPAVPDSAVVAPNFQTSDNVDALLHHVDLFAIYQHPCGFFSRFDALWWAQSNHGYEVNDLAGDKFWQFNIQAGYRFARRKAEIGISLLNIADQNYRLNPLNLTAAPPRERTLAVNFKLDL